MYLLTLLYSPTYCKIGAGNERFQQVAEARYQHRGILRPEFRGPITFNHVRFSYPERKDINVQIAEGECVAIVGPSGARKSTVRRCSPPSSLPTTFRVHLDWRERYCLQTLRTYATTFPSSARTRTSSTLPSLRTFGTAMRARRRSISGKLRRPRMYTSL